MMKETAKILLAYRVKHGLTQAQLAEKIGVTRVAVVQWENENATPTKVNYFKIHQLQKEMEDA